VLGDYCPKLLPMHVLAPANRCYSAKVKAFVDFHTVPAGGGFGGPMAVKPGRVEQKTARVFRTDAATAHFTETWRAIL
jgi:hypothetical protein